MCCVVSSLWALFGKSRPHLGTSFLSSNKTLTGEDSLIQARGLWYSRRETLASRDYDYVVLVFSQAMAMSRLRTCNLDWRELTCFFMILQKCFAKIVSHGKNCSELIVELSAFSCFRPDTVDRALIFQPLSSLSGTICLKRVKHIISYSSSSQFVGDIVTAVLYR